MTRDPETVVVGLAAAYDNLSPAEIREHALFLARVLVVLDDVRAAMHENLTEAHAAYESQSGLLRKIAILQRNLASNLATGQLMTAKNLSAEMADAAGSLLTPTPLPPVPVLSDLEVLFPNLFTPRELANAD